jgi:hypothetical protein
VSAKGLAKIMTAKNDTHVQKNEIRRACAPVSYPIPAEGQYRPAGCSSYKHAACKES